MLKMRVQVSPSPHMRIKCTVCGVMCSASIEEDPNKVVCSDCGFPDLARASKAGLKAVSDAHFKKTGKLVSGNELLRNALGF